MSISNALKVVTAGESESVIADGSATTTDSNKAKVKITYYNAIKCGLLN